MYVGPVRVMVVCALPHLGSGRSQLRTGLLLKDSSVGNANNGDTTAPPTLTLTSKADGYSKKIFDLLAEAPSNDPDDSARLEYYTLIRNLIGIQDWEPTDYTLEEEKQFESLKYWNPDSKWNIPDEFDCEFQAWTDLAIPYILILDDADDAETPVVLTTQFGIAEQKDDLLKLLAIDTTPTDQQIKDFLDYVDTITISLLNVFWQNNAETDSETTTTTTTTTTTSTTTTTTTTSTTTTFKTYQGLTWDQYYDANTAFRQAAARQYAPQERTEPCATAATVSVQEFIDESTAQKIDLLQNMIA